MKSFLFALLASTPLCLGAGVGDTYPALSTTKGKTYISAVVTAVEPDGLSIRHEAGAAKVDFELLPAELQQKYGFSAEKATEHKKAQAEAITTASPEFRVIADIAGVLGKPASAAKSAFGAPTRTTSSSADWSKGGYSWSLAFEDGKTVQGTVDIFPAGKSPKDLAAAAAAFGFTADKGWTIGAPFKRGIMECAFLTHRDLGIHVLKATPGDDHTFSVLNFHVPGRGF